MYTLLVILHVLVCLVLILIVLLQAGKGANMGAAFGGSSQTVFGSTGAGTFLGKLTAAIAVIFMITSLALTYTAARKTSSLIDSPKSPVTRPAVPPAPAQKETPSAVKPEAPPEVPKAPIKK